MREVVMMPLGEDVAGRAAVGREAVGRAAVGRAAAPRNENYSIFVGSEILDFWSLAPREVCFLILGGSIDFLSVISAPRD